MAENHRAKRARTGGGDSPFGRLDRALATRADARARAEAAARTYDGADFLGLFEARTAYDDALATAHRQDGQARIAEERARREIRSVPGGAEPDSLLRLSDDLLHVVLTFLDIAGLALVRVCSRLRGLCARLWREIDAGRLRVGGSCAPTALERVMRYGSAEAYAKWVEPMIAAHVPGSDGFDNSACRGCSFPDKLHSDVYRNYDRHIRLEQRNYETFVRLSYPSRLVWQGFVEFSTGPGLGKHPDGYPGYGIELPRALGSDLLVPEMDEVLSLRRAGDEAAKFSERAQKAMQAVFGGLLVTVVSVDKRTSSRHLLFAAVDGKYSDNAGLSAHHSRAVRLYTHRQEGLPGRCMCKVGEHGLEWFFLLPNKIR